MKMIYEGICDVGLKRQINQDSILIRENALQEAYLYVVADGMGGHSHGERASHMITEGLSAWWDTLFDGKTQWDLIHISRSLQSALMDINYHLFSQTDDGEICGSTCIILLAYRDACITISVGDSRVYRKRKRKIHSLMKDDVWENQREIQEQFSEVDRKKNSNYGKLINAVGVNSNLSMTVQTYDLLPGDIFLLCSDGLYKYCDFLKVKKSLHWLTQKKLKERVKRLLSFVYNNGAPDNVSIILKKAL